MKTTEICPFIFKHELPRIRTGIRGRACRHLILYPDGDIVRRHLSAGSAFCRAAVRAGYLTQQQMARAAMRYRLGMSRDGGVIFWQIDPLDRVCDGKVMYYRDDCHRDHDRLPTWAMSELKGFYLDGHPDLAAELQPAHCLFGTHLLRSHGNTAAQESPKAVAVVEAEKTAVILSELYPQYLWLAAGGMNELTASKLFPLKGWRIILFPDTDEEHQAFSCWYRVCKEAQRLLGQPIHLSPLLEQRASRDQKRRKIDLVDYYFETVRPASK
jgi:hypothetical protein